jgi:hypothetical protein
LWPAHVLIADLAMMIKAQKWFATMLFKSTRHLRINYSFDGDIVTVERPLGRKLSLSLHDVDEIGVETTDRGPFMEDVFWVLKQGTTSLRIPEPSHVFKILMNRFRSLPGFDWRPFTEAMACTDCRYFCCWKRASKAF